MSLINTITSPNNSDIFNMRIGIQDTGVLVIIDLIYISTSDPGKIYRYTIDCLDNTADCTSINVAANLKSITFTDTIFIAPAEAAANEFATGTLTVSGTANWN